MQFESHLKFKRDVRYQSVWRLKAAKRKVDSVREELELRCLRFKQSFLVIGVSVQEEKHMKHTFEKKERGRASKGNYILYQRAGSSWSFGPQNTAQPIPHYFREQRRKGSCSLSVPACHCSLCIAVRSCIYKGSGGCTVCIFFSLHIVCWQESFTLHRTKAMLPITVDFICLMHCHGCRLGQVLLVIKCTL